MNRGIAVITPEETDNMVRFIRDESVRESKRQYFVQGLYNQNLNVVSRRDIYYQLFPHNHGVIEEVAGRIAEASGLEIPVEFYKGSAIYNTNAYLMDRGIHVPFRILRQQIFLSGEPYPVSEQQTHRILFHAIGNALWDFMEYRIWNSGGSPFGSDDREVNNAEKNEYRDLRNYRSDLDKRDRTLKDRLKRQNDLFYVASEDFRCLFGSQYAGRDEWYLDQLEIPVPKPTPEVMNFWRRELLKYGNDHSSTIATAANANA